MCTDVHLSCFFNRSPVEWSMDRETAPAEGCGLCWHLSVRPPEVLLFLCYRGRKRLSTGRTGESVGGREGVPSSPWECLSEAASETGLSVVTKRVTEGGRKERQAEKEG